MATTKILPVRKRLKDCLDYAANPKKTEIFRGDALDRLMHYTQNEDKTEHQLYVTGFNCDPQNACLIMEATKRRWHTILFRALSPAKPARTKCMKSAAN